MWEDKTDYFTEKERHYKDTYLEICEVFDNKVEAVYFHQKQVTMKSMFVTGKWLELFMQMLMKQNLCVNR